ncbi:MAG TPA: UDP-N-acetylmuramoyl-L-alanine--D-glutamate ligase, partial [bacterium]|nr:UDP-N-acetylmuramoyl-L-alanine--D-glutamate ligase [bacterium]
QVEAAKKALKTAVELIPAETLPANFADAFDLILLVTVYPSYAPALIAAKKRGVQILTDLDLASQNPRGKLIAIAGSNGKTSTAMTLKAMLDAQGKKSRLIGGGFLSVGEALTDSKPCDFDILIADSLKLKWSSDFRPHISALLNIYPGFPDKHPNFDDYGQSLSKVFANQGPDDFLVNQYSDDVNYYLKEVGTKAKRRSFSTVPTEDDGAYYSTTDFNLVISSKESGIENFSISPKVRVYPHKLQNTLAAIQIAKICGCTHEVIQKAIDGLKPFPHRLEWFKTLDGVKYYDDSRSRNLAATIFALLSFSKRNIVLIAGGEYMSQQFYKDLVPQLSKKVKCLIIVGYFRDRFFKHWGEATETYVVENLADAVQLAYRTAERGDKVILSPAARADRQFYVNSSDRGDQFKALVAKLDEFSKARKIVSTKV